MKRVLIAISLVLFAAVLVLASSSYWLIKTEQGLQFAVEKAEQWLGKNTSQQLEVNGIKGTLWQGLFIESLTWQDGDKSIEARKVQIKMAWNSLFDRDLVINMLAAESVGMQFPPSEDEEEPFNLPERIDFSVDVDLQDLKVGQFVFNALEFNDIEGKARVKGGQLAIQRFALNTQETDIESSLSIALEKPYPLSGLVTAQRSFDDVLLDAKLQAQGTLERLALTLTALGTNQGRDEVTQSAKAQSVITLFKPSPLETVDLVANGFDPSQWVDGAPRASLNIQAKVQPNADFSQSVGDVSVQNTRPLAVQANGLPFTAIKARFELALAEQQPRQFDLWVDALNFADGKRNAGDATAVLQWRAPKPLEDGQPNPDLMAGDVDFKIDTRNVDASVFASLPQPLSITSSLQGTKNGNVVRVNSLIPVSAAKAIQISGTSTPSRSRQAISTRHSH